MEINTRISPGKRPLLEALFPLFLGLCWLGSLLLLKFQGAWIHAVIAIAVALGLAGSLRKGWIPKAAVLLALAIPTWQFIARALPDAAPSEDDKIISELVSTEERILELTPQLRDLSRGLLNVRLPDASRRLHFAPEVEVADLIDGEVEAKVAGKGVPVPVAELSMWSPLMNRVSWFEHAKFYFIDGRFPGDGYDAFEGNVGSPVWRR